MKASVREKLMNGEYKTKLEYPKRDKKPKMELIKPTAAQARAYADAMDAYEAGQADYDAARMAWHADEQRLLEQFRKDLEAEFDLTGHPKADKVWSKAWEHGHSAGLGEVIYWYDEFADMV